MSEAVKTVLVDHLRLEPSKGTVTIPVHVMRRFFNTMKSCAGISARDRGDLHEVAIDFETPAESAKFYRALSAIYREIAGSK